MRYLPPGFSFKEHVARLFVKSVPSGPAAFQAHALIGLSGEVGEIAAAVMATPPDPAAIAEEAGDFIFYLQALSNHSDYSVDAIQAALEKAYAYAIPYSSDAELEIAAKLLRKSPSAHNMLIALSIAAGRLIDIHKKAMIYDQPLSPDLLTVRTEAYALCYVTTIAIAQVYADHYTAERLMWDNYRKLSARYPDGYTDAAAAARADKAE